jgi:hypothetical protein
MKYISYRGNLNGPVSKDKNKPFYIDAAIFAGARLTTVPLFDIIDT